MDERRYRIWWKLHRRVSQGEPLSEEEDNNYLSGRAELEAEERAGLFKVAETLGPLQQRLRELRVRNQNLLQQEATLRERAAELEQRYAALTGEPLGIEL